MRKKVDRLTLAAALLGLALYAPLFFAARAVTEFLSLGSTITTIALAGSHIIPLSLSADSILFGIKRRSEMQTAPAIVLGTIGTAAGILLLARLLIFN